MMRCRDSANRFHSIRFCSGRWHRIWCSQCRAAFRADAILERGIVGLKSALPPEDGLARTLVAVGVISAMHAHGGGDNSRKSSVRRRLVHAGAATMVVAFSFMGPFNGPKRSRRAPIAMSRISFQCAFQPIHRMYGPAAHFRAASPNLSGRPSRAHSAHLLVAALSDRRPHRFRPSESPKTPEHLNTRTPEYPYVQSRSFNEIDQNSLGQGGGNGSAFSAIPPDGLEKRDQDEASVPHAAFHASGGPLGSTSDLLGGPASRRFHGIDLAALRTGFARAESTLAAERPNMFDSREVGPSFFRLKRDFDLFDPHYGDKLDGDEPSTQPDGLSDALEAVPPSFKRFRMGSGDIRHGYAGSLAPQIGATPVPIKTGFRPALDSKRNGLVPITVNAAAANAPSWWRPHFPPICKGLLVHWRGSEQSLTSLGYQNADPVSQGEAGPHIRLVMGAWPLRLVPEEDVDCNNSANWFHLSKGSMTL